MRIRGIAVLIVLSLASSACASRKCCRGPVRASFDREAETKAVYVAVLNDLYARDWLGREVTQWVIEPGVPAVEAGRDDMVRARAPDARPDTLADFERARPAARVPADLAPGRPVHWFTNGDFAALPKSGASDLGWQAFHQRFPGSGGHITLSHVAFSADGTEALLHPGRWFDSLGGARSIVRLQKVGGVWQVKQRAQTAVS